MTEPKADAGVIEQLFAMEAECERLRNPWSAVDSQDWNYILSCIPDGGRGRFWKSVLNEMRDALSAPPPCEPAPASAGAEEVSAWEELRPYLTSHLMWAPQGESLLRFLTLALCGEAGELANLIKKDWRGDAGDRRDKIVGELADVANYAFLIAEALGIDLVSHILKKARAVEQRVEFAAARAAGIKGE